MFNPEEFRNDASDAIEELLKRVPDDWRADMAAFISMQAVIFGANNTFEGVGIFEINKSEYLDIVNEALNSVEVQSDVTPNKLLN